MKAGMTPSSSKPAGSPAYFLMLIVTFFWAIGHPLGALILKETFSWLFYLGTACILGGIILINTLGNRIQGNPDLKS